MMNTSFKTNRQPFPEHLHNPIIPKTFRKVLPSETAIQNHISLKPLLLQVFFLSQTVEFPGLTILSV